MTLSNIRSLTDNQVVRYRIGKCGPNKVNWESWRSGPIFVTKRTADLPLRARKPGCSEWQSGAVILITPKDVNTAEYSEEDYNVTFNYFSCEEYTFQIDWNSLSAAS